jgi:hypothetical protein
MPSNFLAAGDSYSGIPVRIGDSLLAAIGIYPGIGRYAVKMLANLRDVPRSSHLASDLQYYQ